MTPNDSSPITRRRLLLLGPHLVLGAMLLPACKQPAPASCTETTGLTSDDIKLRVKLGYLDRCADPDKACDRCTQWLAAPEPTACGGCRVMKGPVHPSGTCNVFARSG